MCYYVYVLKSENHNFYYKGFCKDLNVRLSQHNAGLTKSNKHYKPFKVVYVEKCASENEAVTKERFWKTTSGRRYLKDKLLSSFNG